MQSRAGAKTASHECGGNGVQCSMQLGACSLLGMEPGTTVFDIGGSCKGNEAEHSRDGRGGMSRLGLQPLTSGKLLNARFATSHCCHGPPIWPKQHGRNMEGHWACGCDAASLRLVNRVSADNPNKGTEGPVVDEPQGHDENA